MRCEGRVWARGRVGYGRLEEGGWVGRKSAHARTHGHAYFMKYVRCNISVLLMAFLFPQDIQMRRVEVKCSYLLRPDFR